MFELIEDSQEAINKALEFLRKEIPDIAITTPELSSMLPYKDSYPCLLDFYVTHYLNRNHVMASSLSYHFCDKRIAKYLVYLKTNKTTRAHIGWKLIDKGTTLGDFQRIQEKNSGKRPIIESDGFHSTLHECLRNKEPFLLHTLMMRDSYRESQSHQTVVTLELAKALVYYKKNMDLMSEIDIDEVVKILNDFRVANPEIKSMWDSNVMLEIRKKINEESEIPY
jgi:hypothetical protein